MLDEDEGTNEGVELAELVAVHVAVFVETEETVNELLLVLELLRVTVDDIDETLDQDAVAEDVTLEERVPLSLEVPEPLPLGDRVSLPLGDAESDDD